MSNSETMFKDLALGTKFTYLDHKKIWVKIGATTVAEWDEKLKTSRWLGQSICAFDEDDSTDKFIHVL